MVERRNERSSTRPAPRRTEQRSSNGRRRWNYQPRTAEQVNEQINRTRSRFDSPFTGVKFFRANVGDNTVRILPATWRNPKHYSLQIWEHRYQGADESHYLCLRRMKGERCPMCEGEAAARRAGDTEEAKRMSPMERWVCYVLHRDSQTPDEPVLWDMNSWQDKDIVSLTRNKKSGATIFPEDPEVGYDLMFVRTGQMDRTRYSAFVFDRDPSPIHDNPRVVDEIMEKITENPIDSLLNFYDADYLENVLSGTAGEAQDEGEPEEEPQQAQDDQDQDQQDDEQPAEDDDNGQPEDEPQDDDQDQQDEQVDDDQPAAEDEEPELRRGRSVRPPPREERRQERRPARPITRRGGGNDAPRRFRP